MPDFQLVSDYVPTGDQPEAIASLVEGMNNNERVMVLMGVTGSGKTFTMANVIQQVQRPTLILAHNKTLAAQLYGEFKEFFPHNAVEYFVSYYDYYKPEAYIPQNDIYIEKDVDINAEIEMLRHSATSSLFERRDVIVVASVSCIYGLGDPAEYRDMSVSLRVGMTRERDEIVRKLVDIQYERNNIAFEPGAFRVRGDVLEIFPQYFNDQAVRVEFFGDEIERIQMIDVLTGEVKGQLQHIIVFPASHYVTPRDVMDAAMVEIERDADKQVKQFEELGRLIEAQRIKERTMYDIEMMREIGFCTGIENYSRYFDGRKPGEMAYTLLDYFPKDFMIMADESHVTLPQFRGMYAGDRSRKETLVDYGFRLPAAMDNRPLKFEEFEAKINNIICVSATPGAYEMERTSRVAEQIIRPTGLVDPHIFIQPVKGQIDHLMGEVRQVVSQGQRAIVLTMTKKMSEDLTKYLTDMEFRVRYLHSEIDTLDRLEILRDLRLGEFDVIVGINLMREGLDLPEVSLVAILDADKEGFLRNETSLVQVIGRAARNADGRVIMYADKITPSMEKAIKETDRRRDKQEAYNKEHNITPRTIIKAVKSHMDIYTPVEERKAENAILSDKAAYEAEMKQLQEEMLNQARKLEFEKAAALRDRLNKMQERFKEAVEGKGANKPKAGTPEAKKKHK